MKQITLRVKDSKFKFFMELIKNFDFIKVSDDDDDSKEEIIANIKRGIHDLKMIEEGKMKSRPAKELLDEL